MSKGTFLAPSLHDNCKQQVKQFNGQYSCTASHTPLHNFPRLVLRVLELMRMSVGPKVKVKAAGGVRTLDQLLAVQATGCSRCGATATIAMMEDAVTRFGN